MRSRLESFRVRASQNLLTTLAVLIFGMSLATSAWTITTLTYTPLSPFSYTNSPFPVLGGPFHAGDAPRIEVGRCNTAAEPLVYAITRNISTDRGHPTEYLPTVAADFPSGCAVTVSQAHVLPLDLPPGRYKFVFVALVVYRGSSFTARGESQIFEVVP